MKALSLFTRPIEALRNWRAPGREMFAAPSALTKEQALLDQMFGVIMHAPDPDEVLRSAGIRRPGLRIVETDDEVSAALDTRREALIGVPWRLEGGDNERLRLQIAAEIDPHVEALQRGAFAAVPYGYSVVEVIYRNAGGMAGIERVCEKPFEWFRPQQDGQLVYLDPNVSSAFGTGRVVDQRKFLLTVRNPTWRNPYGDALLSRAWWPWYVRQQGMQYWLRWLERYGTPLLIGKTDGDQQKMANSLAAALSSAAVAVGRGDDVQAVTPGSGAGHFENFDATIRRRFQTLILGQTLTTDASSGGSYSAAKVADHVREDRRNADIRLVQRTIQRLVDALWSFNGQNGQAPLFVMADGLGLEKERADRDAVLVEKLGVRLTPQYVAQRYDLAPEDFVMGAPAAAPAGSTGRLPDPGGDQFAAGRRRFTPVQQVIEAGVAARQIGHPIDPASVRSAVMAARDEQDLRDRLAALIPESDPSFADALERATFAAGVLGYVAAEEQRT